MYAESEARHEKRMQAFGVCVSEVGEESAAMLSVRERERRGTTI